MGGEGTIQSSTPVILFQRLMVHLPVEASSGPVLVCFKHYIRAVGCQGMQSDEALIVMMVVDT